MGTSDPGNDANDPTDTGEHEREHEHEETDADRLPSGAGPQAEGDQSDISSGGGTDT